MSYSYSGLQRVHALTPMAKPRPWKAHLQDSEPYNMGGQPREVDAFEIEAGIVTL